MQCDIDILGEPGNLAEIELILATTTLLGKLDFKNFTIRINDRRILKAMAAYSGFAESDYENVFIILDKMDKIGLDGVAAELEENGYAKGSVEKYLQLFKEITDVYKRQQHDHSVQTICQSCVRRYSVFECIDVYKRQAYIL